MTEEQEVRAAAARAAAASGPRGMDLLEFLEVYISTGEIRPELAPRHVPQRRSGRVADGV